MTEESWTFSRITCPDCNFSWTSAHEVGTLLIECPDCEHLVETLTDTDEIKEIEQRKIR